MYLAKTKTNIRAVIKAVTTTRAGPTITPMINPVFKKESLCMLSVTSDEFVTGGSGCDVPVSVTGELVGAMLGGHIVVPVTRIA